MRKLITVTMIIGAGAILLAQLAQHPRRVACVTCHQGWKVQVDTASVPPNIGAVIEKIDERLAVNGKRIIDRRLDPDSERFRDALLNQSKRLGH